MKPYIVSTQMLLFYDAVSYVAFWEACGKPQEINTDGARGFIYQGYFCKIESPKGKAS